MSTCSLPSEIERLIYTCLGIAKQRVRLYGESGAGVVSVFIASRFAVRRGPLHFLPPLWSSVAAQLLRTQRPCSVPSDAGYLTVFFYLHFSSATSTFNSVAIDMDGSHDPFFRRQSSKVRASRSEVFFPPTHPLPSLDDTCGLRKEHRGHTAAPYRIITAGIPLLRSSLALMTTTRTSTSANARTSASSFPASPLAFHKLDIPVAVSTSEDRS